MVQFFPYTTFPQARIALTNRLLDAQLDAQYKRIVDIVTAQRKAQQKSRLTASGLQMFRSSGFTTEQGFIENVLTSTPLYYDTFVRPPSTTREIVPFDYKDAEALVDEVAKATYAIDADVSQIDLDERIEVVARNLFSNYTLDPESQRLIAPPDEELFPRVGDITVPISVALNSYSKRLIVDPNYLTRDDILGATLDFAYSQGLLSEGDYQLALGAFDRLDVSDDTQVTDKKMEDAVKWLENVDNLVSRLTRKNYASPEPIPMRDVMDSELERQGKLDLLDPEREFFPIDFNPERERKERARGRRLRVFGPDENKTDLKEVTNYLIGEYGGKKPEAQLDQVRKTAVVETNKLIFQEVKKEKLRLENLGESPAQVEDGIIAKVGEFFELNEDGVTEYSGYVTNKITVLEDAKLGNDVQKRNKAIVNELGTLGIHNLANNAPDTLSRLQTVLGTSNITEIRDYLDENKDDIKKEAQEEGELDRLDIDANIEDDIRTKFPDIPYDDQLGTEEEKTALKNFWIRIKRDVKAAGDTTRFGMTGLDAIEEKEKVINEAGFKWQASQNEALIAIRDKQEAKRTKERDKKYAIADRNAAIASLKKSYIEWTAREYGKPSDPNEIPKEVWESLALDVVVAGSLTPEQSDRIFRPDLTVPVDIPGLIPESKLDKELRIYKTGEKKRVSKEEEEDYIAKYTFKDLSKLKTEFKKQYENTTGLDPDQIPSDVIDILGAKIWQQYGGVMTPDIARSYMKKPEVGGLPFEVDPKSELDRLIEQYQQGEKVLDNLANLTGNVLKNTIMNIARSGGLIADSQSGYYSPDEDRDYMNYWAGSVVPGIVERFEQNRELFENSANPMQAAIDYIKEQVGAPTSMADTDSDGVPDDASTTVIFDPRMPPTPPTNLLDGLPPVPGAPEVPMPGAPEVPVSVTPSILTRDQLSEINRLKSLGYTDAVAKSAVLGKLEEEGMGLTPAGGIGELPTDSDISLEDMEAARKAQLDIRRPPTHPLLSKEPSPFTAAQMIDDPQGRNWALAAGDRARAEGQAGIDYRAAEERMRARGQEGSIPTQFSYLPTRIAPPEDSKDVGDTWVYGELPENGVIKHKPWTYQDQVREEREQFAANQPVPGAVFSEGEWFVEGKKYEEPDFTVPFPTESESARRRRLRGGGATVSK